MASAQGGVGDRMFFLSSGAIEIFAASGRSLRILKSGDYMGEFALITGEPRSAMAVARSFVLLHVLLKADFERIMTAWPEYETRMAEACEQRLMSAAIVPSEPEPVVVALGDAEEGQDSYAECDCDREERDQQQQNTQEKLTCTIECATAGKEHDVNNVAADKAKENEEEAAVDKEQSPADKPHDDDAAVAAAGVVVDNSMLKDVTAIRTILARRNRLSSAIGPSDATTGGESTAAVGGDGTGKPLKRSDGSKDNATAGAGRRIAGGRGAGARYRFTQPNEPESTQWIDDGGGRRSQGDRFARGHSARFTELQPPPTSRFSFNRPSSNSSGFSASQRYTGRTT